MRRLLIVALVLALVGMTRLAQAADKPDPAGDWKTSVEVDGVQYDMTLKVKLDGGKLTGVVVDSEGKETPLKDAKYKNGQLSFTMVRNEGGDDITLKSIARLKGDTLKGVTAFKLGGEERTLAWEAKRAAAAKPAETAAASPVGTWNFVVEVEGETHEVVLTLKQEGDKLAGMLADKDGTEMAVKDAQYKDGELSFTAVRNVDGEDIPFKSTAKLSGDTMKGKTTFKFTGEDRSMTWEAKRAAAAKPAEAAAEGPAGTWKFAVEVEGQTHELVLTLKQEGDKLAGVLADSDGTQMPLKDVQCKDGELSFTITRNEDGDDMTFKNTAKLSGDTMKGSTVFKLYGEERKLTWEGKRAAAPKSAGAADPAGDWALSIEINGEMRELKLNIKAEGDKLTGSIGGEDREMKLKDVQCKDGELSFTVVRGEDGDGMVIKNKAKLDGDTMKGKAEVEDQGLSLPWEAKRVKK